MYKRQLVTSLLLLSLSMISAPLMAEDDDGEKSFEWYGVFKASLDNTDDGDDSSVSVNNHDTRVGLKGSQKLMDGLEIIYQFELGVDITERGGIDSGRNSFVGYKSEFGKIAIGQYDTPLKKVRGNGAVIFGDTIADSRILIGSQSGKLGGKLDDRVRDAIWYMSPKFNGVEFFVLYSADTSSSNKADDNDINVTDDNENDLTSANITYKNGPIYVGFGYQTKSDSKPGAEDLEAMRLAASYKAGKLSVGGMFETSDKGDNNGLTRDAYIANVMFKVTDKTSVGLQASAIDDYDGSENTGATNVSLGVEHKYTKTTMVYAIASATQNDDNAQFGLAQGGGQDTFLAYQPGEDATGISFGVVQKF